LVFVMRANVTKETNKKNHTFMHATMPVIFFRCLNLKKN
jgi:hypothetical protein